MGHLTRCASVFDGHLLALLSAPPCSPAAFRGLGDAAKRCTSWVRNELALVVDELAAAAQAVSPTDEAVLSGGDATFPWQAATATEKPFERSLFERGRVCANIGVPAN